MALFKQHVLLKLLFLLSNFILKINSDCGPDTLRVNSFKTCVPNSVITQSNFSIYIDRDCKIKFKGCLNFQKLATEAKGKLDIQLGKMKIPIKSDLCVDATKPKKLVGKVATALELSCPLKQGLHCPKASLDLSKEMAKLGTKGDFVLRLDVKHDKGERSCVELKAELK